METYMYRLEPRYTMSKSGLVCLYFTSVQLNQHTELNGLREKSKTTRTPPI